MKSKEINKLLEDKHYEVDEFLSSLPECKTESGIDIKELVLNTVEDYCDLYYQCGQLEEVNQALSDEIDDLEREVEDNCELINSLECTIRETEDKPHSNQDNIHWDDLMKILGDNVLYIDPIKLIGIIEEQGWVKVL